MTNDPIICDCNDVHRSTIENVIKEKGLQTAEQVNKELYFENTCGACMVEVQQILDDSKGN